jgi:hypothetical protein
MYHEVYQDDSLEHGFHGLPEKIHGIRIIPPITSLKGVPVMYLDVII